MTQTEQDLRADIQVQVARLNSAIARASAYGLRTDATTDIVKRKGSASYDRIRVAVSKPTRT